MKRYIALIFSVIICLGMLSGCQEYEMTPEASSYFHIDKDRIYSTSLTEVPVIKSSFASAYAVIPYGTYDNRPNSSATLCINNTTNQMIQASDPFEQIYPASITKIMTALLVLENGKLDDTVTIDSDIIFDDAQAVKLGLKTGDTLTVNELLHGLLITSANDCAVALARYIAGNENDFVEQMNHRAEQLGATHTHFVNPHGLHNENHYTTAYDLYLIFKEVIRHPEFQEITSTAEYTVRYTDGDGNPVEIPISNSDLFISAGYPLEDGITVVAGKTGTTNEAGSCLIVEAKSNNGQDYIALVCGAPYRDSLYYQLQQLLYQTITRDEISTTSCCTSNKVVL